MIISTLRKTRRVFLHYRTVGRWLSPAASFVVRTLDILICFEMIVNPIELWYAILTMQCMCICGI